MKAKRLIEILEDIGVERDVFIGDAFEQCGGCVPLEEDSILITDKGIKIGDDAEGGLPFSAIPKKMKRQETPFLASQDR